MEFVEAKKNLTEEFTPIPFERFCKVTNVGSHKVTHLNYVRPGSLTRSSKRSVASALDILVPLRELFAKLPQSMVLGLTESHFSWNSKLGRCSYCEGRGYIEIPQKYAQPIKVECENCLGAKLSSKSLLPRFKGYNFAEIMNLTLEQCFSLFENHKNIAVKIQRASQFGLGYIQLGQGLDSLSGGELQRLTLAIELKRQHLDGAWFILIQPGTGLHAPDIAVLGELMSVMVDRGASFVLVENREEFIKFGHHIIQFEKINKN
ncbi:MAG: hypothetical protein K2X39_08440 [Silvanigrellaceae bacterium]|nr:hypothetical protein [Silvanigrellaceae bacterium]